jgi:hypothetical protein
MKTDLRRTGKFYVMEWYLRYQWAPSGQRPRMSCSGGDTRGEHSTCWDSRSGPEYNKRNHFKVMVVRDGFFTLHI